MGGGGGGGGSGWMSRLLIPAFFLPKILYLAPGAGGIGVAAATIGNTSARSRVTDKPVPNILADIVLISGTNAAAPLCSCWGQFRRRRRRDDQYCRKSSVLWIRFVDGFYRQAGTLAAHPPVPEWVTHGGV